MRIPASHLPDLLRSLSPARAARGIAVLDSGGNLVLKASRRDCEILGENGHVECVCTSPHMLKHLALTVDAATAIAGLRQRTSLLSAASHLTLKERIAGRALAYAHSARTRGFAPRYRDEFLRTISVAS
jgi:hypothetical protein